MTRTLTVLKIGLLCLLLLSVAVPLGARPSNVARPPSSALRAGCPHEFRPFFAGGVGLLGACSQSSDTPLGAQPATSALSPALVTLLHDIKAADRDQLAVSEEDGRLLRLMVASSGAKRALEIGGASGYSAIWIGLGLRETGGHLTTIEYDPLRAKIAAGNIGRAGLAGLITVVPGDAFKEIPKLSGEFDFVFLDAWKRDYKRFFDMVLPRLRPGGLFLAHNVVNKQTEMRDFLAAIQNNPALFTTIVRPDSEGMSMSVKIR